MDVPSRVKSLISSQMLTQRKFADSIGISPARLNNYLAGLSKVPQDILIKIAEIYNCSLTWLLTGEGDMYKNKVSVRPHEPLIKIDVEAAIACGPAIEVVIDPDEPKEQLYIPASLLSLPPPYYAFRVAGDSMSPTLEEGDYVILSRDWRNIDINGRIVGFYTPDGILLKKMVLQPRQKKGWLFPINHQQYEPVEYTKDTPEISMIGVLILSIRKHT